MKIMFVLSSTAMGGATLSVLTLIEQMKVKGCDVIVVIPLKDDSFINRLRKFNIDCYVVFMRSKEYPTFEHIYSYWRWPIRLFKILWADYKAKNIIADIIKKEKVDIVHTNVGVITCGFEACTKTKIPHVWHIREYGDKDFNIKIYPSKKAFRNALRKSYVISITKGLSLYNHLDEGEKAFVVYNGVRKKEETNYIYPKKDYFLCASRISPEKGFDQILRVFTEFHKLYPNYRLKILGFDPHNYSEQLKKQAKECGIIDYLDFEGYKNNVSDYMSEAKALLVASPYEGFGRMSAEAAFAGCLLVGKNTAGTKEIMDITGGFAFISDTEMLNAMVSICTLSEKEYQERALFAQSQAVKYFSEESYVENVYGIYQAISRIN